MMCVGLQDGPHVSHRGRASCQRTETQHPNMCYKEGMTAEPARPAW